jgi:hypothetical protein
MADFKITNGFGQLFLNCSFTGSLKKYKNALDYV